MTEVVVCIICLNVNVKMYKLVEYNMLENSYKTILGNSYEENVFYLNHACYECAHLLKKFHSFQEKCLRGQSIIKDILQKNGKVEYTDLLSIDRDNYQLSSSLVSISNNTKFDYEYCDVKQEFNSTGKSLTEGNINDDVKTEDYIKDTNSSDLEFTSDEQVFSAPIERKKNAKRKNVNETYSVHKRQKKELSQIDGNKQLVNKSYVKEILGNSRGKGRQVVKIKQKLRRGPKPNSNGLTPEEMKIQDKFTVLMLTMEEQAEEFLKRQKSSNYLNSKYKCDLCYKGFIDPSTYDRHMMRHDPANGSIKCSICNVVFENERFLRNHTRHHNRHYICKTCLFVCKSMTQAKQHQNRHEGKVYKCKNCEYTSSKWSSYLSHKRIKHPSDFVCDMCNCSFVSKLGLSKHKTMMHKNGAVVEKRKEQRRKQTTKHTQEEKKERVRAVTKHMHDKSTKYCQPCDLYCNTRYWNKHIATISHKIKTNKDFTCGVCKETLPSGEALRLHNRRLHPKRCGRKRANPLLPKTWPAGCPHCEELVADAQKYYWHFRKAHPNEPYPLVKNYICDVCGKRFRNNAYLVYHRRTHFNERPYKCQQCPKAFFDKQNLAVHEKWHGDQRPFPCTVCCKAFKTRGALQRHFMLHTGEKPYVCEFCGKAFNQSNSRKGHVKAVHLKEPTSYSRTRPRRPRRAPPANPHSPHADNSLELS